MKDIADSPRRLTQRTLQALIAFAWLGFTAGCLAEKANVPGPTHVDKAPISLRLDVGQGEVVRFDKPVASLFVADETVADIKALSSRSAYVYGKSLGATNVIGLDTKQRKVAQIQLQIGPDLPGVQVKSGRLFAERADMPLAEAITQHGELTAASSKPPLDLSTYAGANQINIRVRFVEISREDLKRQGVDWNAMFRHGSFSFGLAKGSSMVAPGWGGASGTSGDRIDAMIEALRGKGALNILAEPNITAVSGATASFLAGGEIPVPIPVNQNLVGIEYKSYGISLSVRPTLLPGQRIALEVRPEVSTLSPATGISIAGIEVPAFLVRRVDTRVEMGSGQTFAIAGLFQRTSSDDLRKLPLLGDIPILGQLFRSRRFQRNETELVVLITPYLVRPTSDGDLVTPQADEVTDVP